MIKENLKDWRVIIMIFSVILAIYFISPTFQSGVIVKSIETDSPFSGKLNLNDLLTSINDKDIKSPEDVYAFEDFIGTLRFNHNGRVELIDKGNESLGITVATKPFSNLNLGLDLVGGTRVLLKPIEAVDDATAQQMVATLETRINTFGLREAKFQTVKDVSGNNIIQIEMAGGSKEEVEDLLAKQGKFEGKIPKNISLTNNQGILRLGKDNFTIQKQGGKLLIENNLLSLNDNSTIKNIDFQLTDLNDNYATLLFTVFKGDAIKSVCIVEQPGICVSRLIQTEGGWEFNFQIFVTEESAQKFADVTSDMKIVYVGGSRYLESRIYLYLDEKLIVDLGISSDLKGVPLTSPAITGFRENKNEALKEKLTLQSILQSGSLPTGLEIVKIDQISPNLGSEFLRGTMIAVVIAAFSVMAVIYFRYRRFRILLPMMLWSASELILTLGAAALIKWTIDLASIAGLIAAIGTGTNDQIMMVDEMIIGGSDERRIYTLKQRLKRAFFIIFGAAGTIVAAMIPLMFVGIGVMRGFAIVTTLGVLIGVFITRPAFGRVAERILEHEQFTESSKQTTSQQT